MAEADADDADAVLCQKFLDEGHEGSDPGGRVEGGVFCWRGGEGVLAEVFWGGDVVGLGGCVCSPLRGRGLCGLRFQGLVKVSVLFQA